MPVLKTITGIPRTLLGTIVGLTMVHAVVAAVTGLSDDEAYYRLWALAPALSYYDHPPMVAWMMAAGRWIAGDTPLGIRLPAVVTSLLGHSCCGAPRRSYSTTGLPRVASGLRLPCRCSRWAASS